MNERTHTGMSVQKMVRISVLAAIMLLLEMTGLGLIKTAGLEIAILVVPVIVGAITLGPGSGALLGAFFGCISFAECLTGKSPFGEMLLSISPVGTFLTCIPTRILMGFLCGLIFKGLSKVDKSKIWSFGVASLAGAVLNTLFFMSVLCIFFYNTEYIQGFVTALGSANVFAFVAGFIGINGLIETAVCFFAGAAISKAIMHIGAKSTK